MVQAGMWPTGKRVLVANYPTLVQLGSPKAPAAPTSTSLASIAAGQAKTLTNDQIAFLNAQKAQAIKEANDRAAVIGRITQAAANSLKPLGNFAAQDYADFLKANAGLTAGYTGQLRQDADAEAAKAQAVLAAIPGNNQTVVNHGDSLANLLGGLHGSATAQAALTQQALAGTQAARSLPGSVLGSGLTAAYGALGAGNTAAARFDPSIAAAVAKQPQLAHSILGDLISQQQKEASAQALADYRNRPTYYNDAFGRRIEVTSDGKQTVISSGKFTDATGAVYQVGLDGRRTLLTPGKPPSTSGDFSLSPGDKRYDANGNLIATAPNAPPVFDSSKSNSLGYRVDQYGQPILNAKGEKDLLPGFTRNKNGDIIPRSSSTTKARTQILTPSQSAGLATQIHDWKNGITGTANGVPVTDPSGGLPYAQVLQRALAQAPSTPAGRAKATSLVNAEFYGVASANPNIVALHIAQGDRNRGVGLTDSITSYLQHAIAGGTTVDPATAARAIAKAYGVPLEAVRAALQQLSQLMQSGYVPKTSGG